MQENRICGTLGFKFSGGSMPPEWLAPSALACPPPPPNNHPDYATEHTCMLTTKKKTIDDYA